MSIPPSIDSSQGPSAHEDLTIAEHLKGMLAGDEHRPNERGYLDEHGNITWLLEDRAAEFLREFGALHPSDYEAQHGRPWQDDLFSRTGTSQSIPS